MLRNAPSRAASVGSPEMARGRSGLEYEPNQSGLLPWDNAAPSSSLNEAFRGSIGGHSHHSVEFPVMDTNIERRSLSGSRRDSPVASGRESPALPASLGEGHIDDFRFSVDGENNLDELVETQRSEAPWEKLEKNANNFLAFLKMKVNLAGNAGVTLDDMVGSEKTTHIAASAFHCCLVLATKSLIRVEQAAPFGCISLTVTADE